MAINIPIVSTFDSKGVKGLTDSFRQIVSSADSTSKKIKLGMQVGAAGALGAIGGIGAGLMAVGTTFDDAFDKIRINTGKTGPQLDGLKNDLKAVASAVPASFDDASSAISTFSSKLGLSGAPLQNLSEQTLELSRITKTDLGGNLDAVSSLMNNFGVSAADQSGKLDVLFRASQLSGVSVADLANQMSGAGVQLRAVGFDFNTSAGLLATLGKAGLDVGDVMPALGKAMATAAKDGKDAQSAFKDTFAAIKGAPDATAAAQIAMDTFGAKAGPKLAAMIQEGKLSYEDMVTSIGKGDGIMKASGDTQDFGEKLTKLKNQVFVALEPVATGVFNAIGAAMDKLAPVIKKVTDYFSKHKGVLMAVIGVIGGILLTVIAAYVVSMGAAAVATIAATWPILLIIAAIGLLVAGVILAWKHFGWFRTAVKVVFEAIKIQIHIVIEVFKVLWNVIKVGVQVVIDIFMFLWGVIKAVWSGIVDAFNFAWGIISGVFDWISNRVSDVIGIFGTIGDAIGKAIGGVADVIMWPFKMAFNGIAAIWNNTVGKLSFRLPSWIPGIGGKGFDVPDIPEWRALGGSVYKNSAYLVGENGPEMFVPSGNGSIVPNHRLGGGGGQVTNHVTINVSNPDPQAVVNTLRKWMQRNGTLAGAGIK